MGNDFQKLSMKGNPVPIDLVIDFKNNKLEDIKVILSKLGNNPRYIYGISRSGSSFKR